MRTVTATMEEGVAVPGWVGPSSTRARSRSLTARSRATRPLVGTAGPPRMLYGFGFAGGPGTPGGFGGGGDSGGAQYNGTYDRTGTHPQNGQNGGFGGGGGGVQSVSSNSAGSGGFGGGGGQAGGSTSSPAQGGYGGGNGGTQVQSSSSFYYTNAPDGAGGGGAGLGGGVFNDGGSVTIVDSTFTGNSATGGSGAVGSVSNAGGGAGFGGAVFSLNGSLSILNATIDANTVTGGSGGTGGTGNGGAVFAAGIGGTAAVSISNSILANSSTGQDYMAYGSTTSGGVGNLVQSQSGFSGQIVSTADPKLSPLANNGGPTETMALQLGSPASGAGNVAAATAAGLTTDQRGVGHPRVVGGLIDIGAVQYQPLADLLVTDSGSPSPAFAGGDLTYTVVVSNVGDDFAAAGDTLTYVMPADTTLVPVATPTGWTETDSVGVGNNGTLTFTAASLRMTLRPRSPSWSWLPTPWRTARS